MVDHRLGREVGAARRVAEAHQDRHGGSVGGPNVDIAVADHDGPRPLAAGKGDRAVRWPGSGFDTAKVSRPATAVK